MYLYRCNEEGEKTGTPTHIHTPHPKQCSTTDPCRATVLCFQRVEGSCAV